MGDRLAQESIRDNQPGKNGSAADPWNWRRMLFLDAGGSIEGEFAVPFGGDDNQARTD
ncbi:MAG TPA: hypothetical protein VF861_00860 [Telluria sp.]